MPAVTWPNTVYWPFRNGESPRQMKNCELAESGLEERAMPSVPRLKGVGGELGLEVGQLGAAHAGAGRVARLGHEAADHAMEHDAVVEMLRDQLLDLRHVVRREVGAQLDGDPAVLGVEVDGVGIDGCERPAWRPARGQPAGRASGRGG